MENLILEIPNEMARSLQGLAAVQQKTVEQLAFDRLRSLVELRAEDVVGSPAAVRKALLGPPHLAAADVGELEAAIASGKSTTNLRELFEE